MGPGSGARIETPLWIGSASIGPSTGGAFGAPCRVVAERIADRRVGDVQPPAEVANAGAAGQLGAEPLVRVELRGQAAVSARPQLVATCPGCDDAPRHTIEGNPELFGQGRHRCTSAIAGQESAWHGRARRVGVPAGRR